jgi:hypothetical protein
MMRSRILLRRRRILLTLRRRILLTMRRVIVMPGAWRAPPGKGPGRRHRVGLVHGLSP